MFSRSFIKYEITASSVIAHFSDGSQAEGTFLVGADGVKSLVRKQTSPSSEVAGYRSTDVLWQNTTYSAFLEKFNEKAAKGGITIIQDSREQGLPLSCLLEPVGFRDDARKVEGLPEDYVYWVFSAMKPFTSRMMESLWV